MYRQINYWSLLGVTVMRKKEVTSKVSMSRKRKLEAAKKEFHELWKEVKPFIKKRKVKKYSTTGEWTTSG